MALESISPVTTQIRELSDFHMKQSASYDHKNRNHKYHVYRSNKLAQAARLLDDAAFALPADFS